MKINTIYHKPEEICKERKKDVEYVSFAKDEVYHPFMREREFVRALNATKIERMLSKPFVTALSYHKEGIHVLARHFQQALFASGSFDNQVVLWDMDQKSALKRFECNSSIKGLGMDIEGNLYAGQEKTVKKLGDEQTYRCDSEVVGLDIMGTLNVGTTKGVEIFDIERDFSKQQIGTRYPLCISTSPVLTNIIGVGEQGGLSLFDIRIGKVIHSVTVGSRTNDISFSPMDGHIFVSGNEDFCAYLHDIRYLDEPSGIYRGHGNAVVSVEFNPSGTEIATGSFDKTIRIFDVNERKSRDTYYNKRMHNVFGVKYSHDSQFIVSGSDDGSIRVWKSYASKKLGALSKREKEALRYSEALREKYKEVGEISRISKHRFLPKPLKNTLKRIHESYKATERKRKARESEIKDL
ncbi:Sof1 domain-containing U3 snoRNP protein [Encephalitozoon hellem ATCC 50504]|uniref:Component of nucleolar rRNA processing machinery protein Sof1 n=1 Tax=Encephalitozoon hellem TaxID=27973 RepID=A0A9Q9CAQ4_ENCHE|nr:Sof1 domain-containing U3 snoRNP protein [Encephalitozoon hellem ATCC 50504]AFM97774.1 Sof1 domain-containing U3 snoRNP protein [Encephalitozoon hellem ATCC 50504]UTX42544.1 component of nucleolar rRNA processing machinery protein Sof1 [Encephalitozoon hellem]WEL37999.1 component of nucleolar rRNA processing machinery protein Sof1 [Encephalitozoon hellem]|eukprot:XP_003886755.1 Sof1 domain-containing U3 snoRNP protein [Encephalitozoon hellem ATCC 50504]